MKKTKILVLGSTILVLAGCNPKQLVEDASQNIVKKADDVANKVDESMDDFEKRQEEKQLQKEENRKMDAEKRRENLVEKQEIDSRDYSFAKALKEGHTTQLIETVEEGASLDFFGSAAYTGQFQLGVHPLQYSSARMTKLLVELDADCNAFNVSNISFMMLHASKSKDKANNLSLMYAKGADVNLVGKKGTKYEDFTTLDYVMHELYVPAQNEWKGVHDVVRVMMDHNILMHAKTLQTILDNDIHHRFGSFVQKRMMGWIDGFVYYITF